MKISHLLYCCLLLAVSAPLLAKGAYTSCPPVTVLQYNLLLPYYNNRISFNLQTSSAPQISSNGVVYYVFSGALSSTTVTAGILNIGFATGFYEANLTATGGIECKYQGIPDPAANPAIVLPSMIPTGFPSNGIGNDSTKPTGLVLYKHQNQTLLTAPQLKCSVKPGPSWNNNQCSNQNSNKCRFKCQ